jgi:hypothetical protein
MSCSSSNSSQPCLQWPPYLFLFASVSLCLVGSLICAYVLLVAAFLLAIPSVFSGLIIEFSESTIQKYQIPVHMPELDDDIFHHCLNTLYSLLSSCALCYINDATRVPIHVFVCITCTKWSTNRVSYLLNWTGCLAYPM